MADGVAGGVADLLSVVAVTALGAAVCAGLAVVALAGRAVVPVLCCARASRVTMTEARSALVREIRFTQVIVTMFSARTVSATRRATQQPEFSPRGQYTPRIRLPTRPLREELHARKVVVGAREGTA